MCYIPEGGSNVNVWMPTDMKQREEEEGLGNPIHLMVTLDLRVSHMRT